MRCKQLEMNICGCHSGNHHSIECHRFVERIEMYENTMNNGYCILVDKVDLKYKPMP